MHADQASYKKKEVLQIAAPFQRTHEIIIPEETSQNWGPNFEKEFGRKWEFVSSGRIAFEELSSLLSSK
jgi:hypothetical protein